MNVLVGIDGTERSYHALQFACQLLDETKDSVTLYFSPPYFRLSSQSEISDDIPDLARGALAEAVFEKAKARLPDSMSSSVETWVGSNQPFEGLMAATEQCSADMVVIGAHGSTRRPTFFIGGTARKIAHHCPKPVLLVRETQTCQPPQKIMVACDDGNLWKGAATFLANLSWPLEMKAMLFHVVSTLDEEHLEHLAKYSHPSISDPDGLVDDYHSSIERQKLAINDNLTSYRDDLPSLIKNADIEIRQGHVVDSIVREITDSNIELVAVGSRHLNRFGRLLGSTTESLLIRSPCSLLIVHQQEEL